MQPISRTEFVNQLIDYEDVTNITQHPVSAIVVFWKNSYSHNDLLFNTLETLEQRYAQHISFRSVEVEQEPLLAADLGIRKVPTWLFVHPQKPPRMLHGIPEMQKLYTIIDQFFRKK